MKTFWGDLHNHCAVSYGQGSPQLALHTARQHLDFCSITGHAFWPDMPIEMDLSSKSGFAGIHLGGFAKLKYFWKGLLRELEEANRPGSFVTLPSYEWHSSLCGDYCCYAPDFDLALIDASDVRALARKLKRVRKEFMLLPHHCGYAQGSRGLNWKYFDERTSPLIEIFSNHGCCEADDAPFPYYHSMGPRTSESMLRTELAAGRRFGFYASTDSHDGYPGHFGHGKVGVLADRLESKSIWRALKERKTIASTGVNIVAELDAGDVGIGGVASARNQRDLRIRVEGDAPLDTLDLIEGGAGQWRVRRLAVPDIEPVFSPGRYKIKLEAGWGHGGQVSAWNVQGRLLHGTVRNITPYFRFSTWDQSSPRSTESLRRRTSNGFDWSCRATANPSAATGGTHFSAGGTQAIVLDIEAGINSRLRITFGGEEMDVAVRDLVRGSKTKYSGGFVPPAFKIHRAIPEREFATVIVVPDYTPLAPERSFVYLRIRQTDGQAAWVSPIWFE